MSHKIIKFCLAVLTTIPLVASAQLAENSGFSGELTVIGGMTSTDSNLSTNTQKNKQGLLNSGGSRENTGIFGALGNITYTFGVDNDRQFFAGTSREDIAVGNVALEVGYKQLLTSGTRLTISYLPTLLSEDVWSDPFLVNSARTETERSGNAFRLKLDSIVNSPLSIDVAYARSEIDDERSGSGSGLTAEEQDLLRRGSDSVYMKVSYRHALVPGSGLSSALIYRNSEADGGAMAHDSAGGELSYFSFQGQGKYVLTGSYEYRDYDQEHPVFESTRSDNVFGVFLAYEYMNFLGIRPLSLVSLAGYNVVNSNISFYDESQYLLTVGASYQF
ncbi:DUF2860 family protein [Endozoicomonas sp. SCSIO W0465]|uniref:DUF2860 family protein n=1 Tax=Endozoicomonas sp. SCSIO W0465 TaxID=2918516 RepID=UPI0020756971|nr:DUF2860 family protein [Endozoicomonas sp. SCSIO W0465]USE36261.1 DUF2860 domain-containing protein [Endozoicomonas sp. SCSIO W0465]